MTRELAPVSPGEMLMEEFLKPLSLSQYALARAVHVPPRRINEIVHGKRAVTADTDLRLCRFLGLSEGWWLRLQSDYDIALAKECMAEVLSEIEPLPRGRDRLRPDSKAYLYDISNRFDGSHANHHLLRCPQSTEASA
jgi:addiction module HigA family antidote